MKLDSIKVSRKTGQELFKNTDLKLNDFWAWAYSDLLTNTNRGILAEFIVAKALQIDSPKIRIEWDAFDLKYKNKVSIEVKSAAYIQTWKQNEYSKISFGIAPTKKWNYETNKQESIATRQADLYIFCLLKHKDQKTINPLNLQQWEFYLLPTKTLDNKIPKQKSISLNSLIKFNPVKSTYWELQDKLKKINCH